MSRNVTFRIVTASAVALSLAIEARPQSMPRSAPPASQCRNCHTCAAPSAADACLRLCPYTSEEDASPPNTVLLDELEDLYLPVPFDHEGHARMADMSDGCVVCHHHTPEGMAHPACKSCHAPAPAGRDASWQTSPVCDAQQRCTGCHRDWNDATLRFMPGLKGAYHRQCMSCHSDWSHSTACGACHQAKVGRGDSLHHAPVVGDVLRRMLEPISAPVTNVYRLEPDSGAPGEYAVFRHQEHAERFGLRCAECHHDERCSSCHSNVPSRPPVERMVDRPHQRCSRCHEVEAPDRCSRCHWNEGEPEPPPFDHALTGWALNRYHEETSCRSCHEDVPYTAPVQRDCRSCHEAWTGEDFHRGALGESPVVAGASDCAACHDRLPGGTRGHATGRIRQAIPQALVDAGGRRGSDPNELDCLVCHSSETTAFETVFARVEDPTALCAACHPDRAGVVGSAHDLRDRAPAETNVIGQTAVDGGACSACHLAHGSGRASVPASGDPEGVCSSCHRDGACGQAKRAGSVAHPDTVCTDCHDPHAPSNGKFLAANETELCSTCHAQQVRLVGGPHDISREPASWPTVAREAGGVCLPCHVPHGARRDLLRVHSGGGYDEACVACHADAGWEAGTELAVIHPRDIPVDLKDVDSALIAFEAGGRGRMVCTTCHDPHGGSEPGHLARVSGRDEGWCVRCHASRTYMSLTGHSQARLGVLGFEVDSCKPCHTVHAGSDDTWGQLLSPRFLILNSEGHVDEFAAASPCLVCHRDGGPAPLREFVTHPELLMFNVIASDAPGFLPLFDGAGRVDRRGRVTCRTCHVAHGRTALLREAARVDGPSEAVRGAMRVQVRPWVTPNICTGCHGAEARHRFLFFHDGDRRTALRGDHAS